MPLRNFVRLCMETEKPFLIACLSITCRRWFSNRPNWLSYVCSWTLSMIQLSHQEHNRVCFSKQFIKHRSAEVTITWEIIYLVPELLMYGTAYLSLSSLPLLVNSFKMDCESQELRYDWEPEISGTGSRSRVDEFWVLRVILLHQLNNMGIEAVVELRGGRGGLPLKDVHGGPRETSGLRGYKGPVKQSIHDINISTDVDVFRSPETWLLGPRRGLRKFFSYLASLAIFYATP